PALRELRCARAQFLQRSGQYLRPGACRAGAIRRAGSAEGAMARPAIPTAIAKGSDLEFRHRHALIQDLTPLTKQGPILQSDFADQRKAAVAFGLDHGD